MATANDYELDKIHSLLFAKFFHAFMECSDEIQTAVREMIAIVVDQESEEDEREMALATIADALFPNRHNGEIGIELEESERMGAEFSDETRQVLDEMDQEEATFAEQLRTVMKEKEITQADLAKRIGIGQPAISMMLNRQCRPQRRTISKLAESLGVLPQELWPTK